MHFETLSWKEIEDAMKSIRNGKSPRPNEVTVEMVKPAHPVGLQWLYCVLKSIWDNRGVPDEWNVGEVDIHLK